MNSNVLLLGGTDVALAIAETMLAMNQRPRAIVTPGEQFSISYSDSGVTNYRNVDFTRWGERHAVPIIRYGSYDDIIAELTPNFPPLCLVAGWYHMLPASFRDLFSQGCFGFHASLLPQLRGGAPLGWAILSGLSETGVTLFRIEKGVDDGLVYGQERFPVGPRATIAELVAASAEACVALTKRHLSELVAGTAQGRSQQGEPSYGQQRTPEDGIIDWGQTAESIDRLVRASGRPYAGAFAQFEGKKIHIWTAEMVPSAIRIFGAPGQIANIPEIDFPCVVAGEGAIVVREAAAEDGEDFVGVLRRCGNKRFRL